MKAQALLLTVKMAFVSASVESAAIDVCMFVHQEVMTPLSMPTFACIERLSGRMFAKAEST